MPEINLTHHRALLALDQAPLDAYERWLTIYLPRIGQQDVLLVPYATTPRAPYLLLLALQQFVAPAPQSSYVVLAGSKHAVLPWATRLQELGFGAIVDRQRRGQTWRPPTGVQPAGILVDGTRLGRARPSSTILPSAPGAKVIVRIPAQHPEAAAILRAAREQRPPD